jgi:uncharacterized protein (DUF983 family)
MTDTPPAVTAIKGLCPHCGEKTLFAGLLSFAPKCRACGLDFAEFNVGDGPAAFLIFIVGGLTVALGMWVELAFEPPLWVHPLLWIPFATVLTVGLLRLSKALLLTLEYRKGAREARIADRE